MTGKRQKMIDRLRKILPLKVEEQIIFSKNIEKTATISAPKLATKLVEKSRKKVGAKIGNANVNRNPKVALLINPMQYLFIVYVKDSSTGKPSILEVSFLFLPKQ